jgi:hypothetical protein
MEVESSDFDLLNSTAYDIKFFPNFLITKMENDINYIDIIWLHYEYKEPDLMTKRSRKIKSIKERITNSSLV